MFLLGAICISKIYLIEFSNVVKYG